MDLMTASKFIELKKKLLLSDETARSKKPLFHNDVDKYGKKIVRTVSIYGEDVGYIFRNNSTFTVEVKHIICDKEVVTKVAPLTDFIIATESLKKYYIGLNGENFKIEKLIIGRATMFSVDITDRCVIDDPLRMDIGIYENGMPVGIKEPFNKFINNQAVDKFIKDTHDVANRIILGGEGVEGKLNVINIVKNSKGHTLGYMLQNKTYETISGEVLMGSVPTPITIKPLGELLLEKKYLREFLSSGIGIANATLVNRVDAEPYLKIKGLTSDNKHLITRYV